MMIVKSKIDLVIFDLDDTLIDTNKRDFFSFIYLINKYQNLNFKSLNYGDFIAKRKEGKTAMELIDAIIPYNLKDRSELLMKCIQERNSIFENEKYLLFDQVINGVEKVLRLLKEKDIKIGIASLRRNYKGFREILDRFNLSQLIDICYCSGDLESEEYKIYDLDNINIINNPTSLQHIYIKISLYKKIIYHLNCEKSKVIIIGDRTTDLIAAKALSLISIGVQSGYNSRDKLWNDGTPYAVIKDVTYLPLILKDLQNE